MASYSNSFLLYKIEKRFLQKLSSHLSITPIKLREHNLLTTSQLTATALGRSLPHDRDPVAMETRQRGELEPTTGEYRTAPQEDPEKELL